MRNATCPVATSPVAMGPATPRPPSLALCYKVIRFLRCLAVIAWSLKRHITPRTSLIELWHDDDSSKALAAQDGSRHGWINPSTIYEWGAKYARKADLLIRAQGRHVNELSSGKCQLNSALRPVPCQ